MNRRRFLSAVGASVALPRLSMQQQRLDRIGIQLYTVRSAMEQDFDGTLVRIASIGYREVEFAGYFGRSPAAVRKTLASAGLTAPSTHVEAKTIETEWARTLEDAAAIGHRYVTAAWIDADRRTGTDDWMQWAERFNRAGEQAKAAGLRFAYHNHDYEFVRTGGRVPYDILVENTDPALVAFEMDLFWIISAGFEPLDYFAKHPGRFPMVHVKDMTAAPARRMVDVGQGSIDFARIFAHAGQAGIQHWFVEHDEPESAFDSARVSYDYLRALRF
jgi:sugar phosphate isomerase/epimerase